MNDQNQNPADPTAAPTGTPATGGAMGGGMPQDQAGVPGAAPAPADPTAAPAPTMPEPPKPEETPVEGGDTTNNPSNPPTGTPAI